MVGFATQKLDGHALANLPLPAQPCGSVPRLARARNSSLRTDESEINFALFQASMDTVMRQSPSPGLTVRSAMIWIASISIVMAPEVMFGERTSPQSYSAISSAHESNAR